MFCDDGFSFDLVQNSFLIMICFINTIGAQIISKSIIRCSQWKNVEDFDISGLIQFIQLERVDFSLTIH